MSSRSKYYKEYPRSFRKCNVQRDRERRAQNRKNRKKKNTFVFYSILLALAVFVIVCSVFFLKIHIAKKDLLNNQPKMNSETIEKAFREKNYKPVISGFGSSIEYNDNTYIINDDIISIAFFGIDKTEFGLVDNTVGTGGQADVIVVAVYNCRNNDIKFLVVPRDSVVEINTYDINGNYNGVLSTQICLSFAYGDGKETSCLNVLNSLSRLLFEIPIKYYASMDLSGIGNLNDVIGGITLNSIETIAEFEQGKTYSLWGKSAESYVRARNIDLLNSDEYRQARQKQYFKAFAKKIVSNAEDDFSFVSKIYKESSKYIVTNISLDEAIYLASTIVGKNITFDKFISVPGEYVKSGVHAQFDVDYPALFETVLELFYEIKEENG